MSSSANLRGIRTGTPVPRMNIEKSGSGPVVTYQLSSEELERYRNMNDQKSKRGEKPMELSKEEYLSMRLKGVSRTQVYTTLGIKPPTLYNALEKWGIKDRQVEDELLASMRETASTVDKANEPNICSPQPVQNSVDKSKQPKLLDYVTIRIPLSFSLEPIELVESVQEKPITRKEIFSRAIQSLNSAVEWAYRDMVELVGDDLAHEQIQKYVDKRMNDFTKAGASI